jgi:hypothetical protein
MKAVVNLGFTFLVAILIALPSCKKSDSGQKVTLTEVLTGGDLFVHLYQEGSTDKTSDYTGYLFTFNTNGNLVVTRGALTYNGTWLLTQLSDTRLKIQFVGTGVEPVLLSLQNDWLVADYSVDLIQLVDDSGGNKTLHFATK